MAERYSVKGEQALVINTTVTSIAEPASGMRRANLFEISLGSSSAAADASAEIDVERFTAHGTGTSVTPTNNDVAGVASVLEGRSAHSAEPSWYTSPKLILYSFGVHQRSSPRWFDPEGFIVPATAEYGIAAVCRTINTQFTEIVHFRFLE